MAGRADFAGARMALTPTTADDGTTTFKLQVDSAGGTGGSAATPTYVQQASQAPTAGTDLSGTATTTSGAFNLPANPARRPGDVQGQNVGANTIGFNEFGGTAAIGSPGTYTVPAGATFAITTTNQVNFIAAGGNSAVTITRV